MMTIVNPDAEILLNHLAAARTHLGCGDRVNHHDRAFRLFHFDYAVTDQLRPGCIPNALSHAATFADLLWREFLEDKNLERINQIARVLMSKVLTPEPDPLVNTSKRLLAPTVLVPQLGVLGRVFQLLNSLEVGLVTPEETRVLDLGVPVRTVRDCGEGLQPHIHSSDTGAVRKWLRFDLAGEG